MAKVAAINISEIRGIQKHEIPEAFLKEDWGGMEVHTLPVGTRLKIGEALTEVTQIGKECHKGCAIREITGDCVMPREGIFVKVLRSGNVKTGDEISVCEGE